MAKGKVPGIPVGKGRVTASGKVRAAKSGRSVSAVSHKVLKGKNKGVAIGAKPQPTSSPVNAELSVAGRYLSRDGLVDVDLVAKSFGMTKASLAETLGFADDTLQRFSRTAAPKTQRRLRDMLEILTRVERWAGGMPQALGWYRGQGIPALGDQTAEVLVKSDQAVFVRRYLDGLAAGSFA
jgi:hypothetical protein